MVVGALLLKPSLIEVVDAFALALSEATTSFSQIAGFHRLWTGMTIYRPSESHPDPGRPCVTHPRRNPFGCHYGNSAGRFPATTCFGFGDFGFPTW